MRHGCTETESMHILTVCRATLPARRTQCPVQPGRGRELSRLRVTGARGVPLEADMARITALTLDPIRFDVANALVDVHWEVKFNQSDRDANTPYVMVCKLIGHDFVNDIGEDNLDDTIPDGLVTTPGGETIRADGNASLPFDRSQYAGPREPQRGRRAEPGRDQGPCDAHADRRQRGRGRERHSGASAFLTATRTIAGPAATGLGDPAPTAPATARVCTSTRVGARAAPTPARAPTVAGCNSRAHLH